MIFTKKKRLSAHQKIFNMYRKTAYCFVILFSFISIVQAQKGNITLSPQIFVHKFSSTYKDFGFASSIHYYLGNRVAIGGIFITDVISSTPKVASSFNRRKFGLQFIPEVQINLSKRKLIPFIKFQIFDYNLIYTNEIIDNLHIPPRLRNRKIFILDVWPLNISTSLGLNYKLTNKLGVTGLINLRTTEQGKIFNTINVGFGVQYDLRHKE